MEFELDLAPLYRELPDRILRRVRSGERFRHYCFDLFPNLERIRLGADVFVDERRFGVRVRVFRRLRVERFVLRGERVVSRFLGRVFRRNGIVVVWRLGKLFGFLWRRFAVPLGFMYEKRQRIPIQNGAVSPVRRSRPCGCQLPCREAGSFPILHPGHRRGLLNGRYEPILQHAGMFVYVQLDSDVEFRHGMGICLNRRM